jgi:hypothetical protein
MHGKGGADKACLEQVATSGSTSRHTDHATFQSADGGMDSLLASARLLERATSIEMCCFCEIEISKFDRTGLQIWR